MIFPMPVFSPIVLRPVEIEGTATAFGSTSSSVYTSGSISIGAASNARHVVVAVSHRLDVDPTGCTVGGISAGSPIVSVRATAVTPDLGVSLFWVPVPTGTSAVVTVTFPSGNNEVGITLFRMLHAGSVSDSDGAFSNTNSVGLSTVTIPVNGVGVWSGAGTLDPNELTWANATRYSNFDAGTYQSSGAFSVTAGTPSVTLSQTSATNMAVVGAAFAP